MRCGIRCRLPERTANACKWGTVSKFRNVGDLHMFLIEMFAFQTILEAVVPPYLTHIQTNKTEGKTERDVINHIAVAMKTLINNCEPLAKYAI
jgi:hypothetical protein